MSGSWEQQPQVLVVILTREVTSVAWAFAFRNLIIPGSYTGLSGMPFDHARNSGCQKLLEVGWDYIMMLDDDMILPNDAILRLMAHRQPIVSGLYYRRNQPICPVMLRNSPDGGSRQWITEFKVPDLMEVDYVGSGCMLIHRSVLLTVPQPWFEWKVDRMDLPEKERMSEDFSFCQNARNKGIKVLVDTSVQCIHCGLSQSKIPGIFEPLDLMH
jgi:hypothetical protein